MQREDTICKRESLKNAVSMIKKETIGCHLRDSSHNVTQAHLHNIHRCNENLVFTP